MNTHDDNDALPGDDELKALYRSLPRKEPSPELDAAVRRAAADAVRAERGRRVTRWPVAVASAAVIVVAAGLSWRTMQQPSSVPQIPAAPAVVAKSTASNEPVNPASTPAVADAVSAEVAAPQAAARMAAAVSPKKENIGSAMKPKVVARVIATDQPPAVAMEPAPMASEDSVVATPLAAPRPPAPAPALAMAPAPAPMPAPAPVPTEPPAPPAPVAEATASAYAPMAAPTRGTIVAGLNQRASTTMKTMAVAAPMPALDTTTFNPTDTPDQELAKIRRLVALQHHDEAVQRLTSFQQAHPDVPLPDDLRAQLPDHE